jgi:hypothetical protein
MKSWSGHFHTLAEIKIQPLMENPGGKRLFGRPKHRQEEIKMDLRKTGCVDSDKIHLANMQTSGRHL